MCKKMRFKQLLVTNSTLSIVSTKVRDITIPIMRMMLNSLTPSSIVSFIVILTLALFDDSRTTLVSSWSLSPSLIRKTSSQHQNTINYNKIRCHSRTIAKESKSDINYDEDNNNESMKCTGIDNSFDNNQMNDLPTSSSSSMFATSTMPQKLQRGAFLGFQTAPSSLQRRNTIYTTTTQLQSLSPDTAAVMPDGGITPCVIRLLGIGGGGCNAVDRMLQSSLEDGIGRSIDYWAINTDSQALGRSKALGANILNIGATVTSGLGAGGDPTVGAQAAVESADDITKILEGTDLCFITAGMGGGTGSGAAPVISEISKEIAGALTIAIVTKPFSFEGRRRMKQATDAIEQLRQHVDTVIVVSNNKLLEIIPEGTSVQDAFRVADDILRQGVVGITEIIVRPGLINVDFADVRAIMRNAGSALMGVGTGRGINGAQDAARAAISSPLLDEPVQDATGVVFNIMGPPSLTLQDVNAAAQVIYDSINEDANVIFGALIDETMDEEISITVLATGYKSASVSILKEQDALAER